MAVDRQPLEQMVLDVGGDAFQRLARLFEEETRGAVVALRQLLIAADWRELGRQAHSLKHATSSFGLGVLAAIAARIEQAADAQEAAVAAAGIAALEAAAETELAALDEVLQAIGT